MPKMRYEVPAPKAPEAPQEASASYSVPMVYLPTSKEMLDMVKPEDVITVAVTLRVSSIELRESEDTKRYELCGDVKVVEFNAPNEFERMAEDELD